MIFFGRAGIGKIEAAVTLAQALNCLVSENDACGSCPGCIRIREGRAPGRSRPAARGSRRSAPGGGSARGHRRVSVSPVRRDDGASIILADAERMNPTTANTLLKTLEEPPPWATIILVTANEAALLPTVLSRCQIFRFSPLAPEELESTPAVPPRDSSPIGPRFWRRWPEEASRGRSSSRRSRSSTCASRRSRSRPSRSRAQRPKTLVPLADSLSKEPRLMLLFDLLLSILRDLTAKTAEARSSTGISQSDIESLAKRAPLDRWLEAFALTEEVVVDLRDRYLNKRISMSKLLHVLPGSRRESVRRSGFVCFADRPSVKLSSLSVAHQGHLSR